MAWFLLVSFSVSCALTYVMRGIALKQGMLDHPNERSSHVLPTPRGGGLAIVAASILLQAVLFWNQAIDLHFALALMVCGSFIAYVGFADDRGSVSVGRRSCVHFAAALLAVFALRGLPAVQVGKELYDLGIAGDCVAIFAVIWILNLFNFMDGIDGIAGSEAVFVTGVGALLGSMVGVSQGVSFAALVICGASLGFLVWNWPSAKIFMGDVGSGYLGYVIAILALASAADNPVMLFVWLILGGVFFCDATITLLTRLLRSKRIFEAHRSHAYQRMARRWNSHRRVTLWVWGINVLWLGPHAFWSVKYPTLAPFILIIALAPLVVLALVLGAGREESPMVV